MYYIYICTYISVLLAVLFQVCQSNMHSLFQSLSVRLSNVELHATFCILSPTTNFTYTNQCKSVYIEAYIAHTYVYLLVVLKSLLFTMHLVKITTPVLQFRVNCS